MLSREDASHYSFTGMKRKLNVHQQSLTRALARLEDLGFVEKSLAGYRLNKKVEIAEITDANVNKLSSVFPRNVTYQLLHARIPVRIDTEKILIGLHGKWFDKYRFIGSRSTSNGYLLKWLNEEGSFELILTIVGNYCIIDTNADSEELRLHAMFGASRLIREITKLVQRKLHGFRINAIGNNNIALTPEMN